MSSEAATPTRVDARKILTVVVANLTQASAPEHGLDVEVLQRLTARWYEVVREAVDRHGGVLKRLTGDAAVVVFGLPRVHEDDALRAVRAAAELRAVLGRQGERPDATGGASAGVRIGISTGEALVLEGNGDELGVAGDAVNVAARLQRSAEPGDVLLGDVTHRLVSDSVTAEPAEPLPVEGTAPPVRAWRLREVRERDASRRPPGSALVDRERELAVLNAAFEQAERERSCRLVTVVGAAGVGKSRLVAEVVGRLSDRALVVQGRCLAHGEGITFWPVAAAIRQAAGIEERHTASEARRRLAAMLPAAPEVGPVRNGLAGLLGLAPLEGVQQTFWAVRRAFEQLAAERPLVLIFEDVQWGEATFLDLLEYLADRLRGAPVLLVCQTRPELLEARPSLTTARPDTTLSLTPLDAQDAQALLRNLGGGAELPAAVGHRIAKVAEGNPLFIEELLRLLVETGVLRHEHGAWQLAGDVESTAIPPTIQALLAARLDQLDPDERAVVDCASVLGRFFWWSAVAELVPDEIRPRVGGLLQGLTRKDLLRPSEEEVGPEDAFEFAHILIRDLAYQCLPKAVRAELHERFGDWIIRRTGERRGEYDEIVGYHLEVAHRTLVELGLQTIHARDLAERASNRLAAAGRRAAARGDTPAALNLLKRAVSLLEPNDQKRLRLLDDIRDARASSGDVRPPATPR